MTDEPVSAPQDGTADAGTVTDPAEGAGVAPEVASFFAPEVAIADDAEAVPYTVDALPETVVVDETAGAADAGEAATVETVTQVVSTDLGMHRYLICENQGNLGGVTYDRASYIVDVEVKDVVDEAGMPVGKIEAAVVAITRVEADGVTQTPVAVAGTDGMDNVTFKNTYQVTTPSYVTIEGTKALTGRDMAADEFGFSVYDADGELVAGGQNTAAADGEASELRLGTVTITEPGIYEYTIAENRGSLGGVAYDGRSFSAVVTVTDNLDGTMSYQVEYPDGPVAFVNEYATVDGASVTVTPEATKTLAGRDMVAGEFTFTVTDSATGNVVARGANAADGTVAFDAIELAAKGDYEFVITEVNGRQDGMTYDTAAYRMLVAVADDGEGGLTAEVGYPDGLPRFENSYKEPEKPKPADPQVPKTGDDGMNLAGTAALGLGGLGVALLGGGVLLRRRASR